MRYQTNTQQSYQNRHMYRVSAQMQVIVYMHKASMMIDHYSQHEQHTLIRLKYITINTPNVVYNGHKCYI